MPVISQPGFVPGQERVNGVGDTQVELFFSPAKPGKLIWGVVGLYIPPIALVTACRLARPTSWWARRKYDDQPEKLEKAKQRYKGEDKVVKPEAMTSG